MTTFKIENARFLARLYTSNYTSVTENVERFSSLRPAKDTVEKESGISKDSEFPRTPQVCCGLLRT